MDKKWNKAGLAAVIMLAPGGFILGATLAARYWQKRRVEKAAAAESDSAA
jgi:hypothetical protein